MHKDLFDIRDFEFFKNKNIFSGSVNKYNYKIIPNDENFDVYAWLGDFCLDKSENAIKATFPFTDEGLEQTVMWIKQQYKIL